MIEEKDTDGEKMKHSNLFHALEKLEKAINFGENLLTEIKGEIKGPKPPKEVVEPPTPPLAIMLSETPTNIIALTDRLNKLFADLRSVLF